MVDYSDEEFMKRDIELPFIIIKKETKNIFRKIKIDSYNKSFNNEENKNISNEHLDKKINILTELLQNELNNFLIDLKKYVDVNLDKYVKQIKQDHINLEKIKLLDNNVDYSDANMINFQNKFIEQENIQYQIRINRNPERKEWTGMDYSDTRIYPYIKLNEGLFNIIKLYNIKKSFPCVSKLDKIVHKFRYNKTEHYYLITLSGKIYVIILNILCKVKMFDLGIIMNENLIHNLQKNLCNNNTEYDKISIVINKIKECVTTSV